MPDTQQLLQLVNAATSNPIVQKDLQTPTTPASIQAAFSAAGLPAPTQAQIDALMAIQPSCYASLQALGASFNTPIAAN